MTVNELIAMVQRPSDITPESAALLTHLFTVDKVGAISTDPLEVITAEQIRDLSSKKVQIEITSEMLLSSGAAQNIIAAAPSGYFYCPQFFIVHLKYGTTTYSCPGSDGIKIRFTNHTADQLAIIPKTFLESTADLSAMIKLSDYITILAETGIEIICSDGSLTTGDSTITLDIFYTLQPIIE